MKYQTLTLLCLMFILGCESSTTPVGDLPATEEAAVSVQSEKETASTETPEPLYHPVLVKLEKYEKGPSTTITFSPQKTSANTTVTHGATLGTDQPGESVKVTWTYLKTDEQGDHYHFEKTMRNESSQQKTMSKEIQYTGKKQLIFEDDFQRTWIYPAPADKEEPGQALKSVTSMPASN
ncbi:hypothetical protein Mal35_05950 [Gimesia maris]|uniref:hypothetical protein n=1 Tax=Gimesia maris TaxID=122 RepID=UPI00118A3CC2|nr:hypothetical protein [Gimesia maris]QDT77170.1 hypothetical protein Mal35_05950 [Gimesia maris]